jgi:rRNA maturation RNase YbeY
MLRVLGADDADLSILLTDDAEIQALNRRFLRKNRPTDVLSFPMEERGVLGDVAISLETARIQAREQGHDILAEVTVLLAHGILHLCGYDHERGPAQVRRMRARERRLLAAAGLRGAPLTGRGADAREPA